MSSFKCAECDQGGPLEAECRHQPADRQCICIRYRHCLTDEKLDAVKCVNPACRIHGNYE